MRLLWRRISFVKFWIGLSEARIVRNFTGKYKLIHCIQIRVILIFMKYRLRTVNEAFCAKKLLFTSFSSRLKNMKFYNVTRMHSSRMRTTRSSRHLLGGVCLNACWDIPLGVGLETPPGHTPQLPPWCGPRDPLRPDLSTSPFVWAWRQPQARPLNFPPGYGPGVLQCMLGYQPPPPPLWTEWQTCIKT